jgi:predicted RNA-binding Zn-ribbon protein involved in translation (DUF1610 family)
MPTDGTGTAPARAVTGAHMKTHAARLGFPASRKGGKGRCHVAINSGNARPNDDEGGANSVQQYGNFPIRRGLGEIITGGVKAMNCPVCGANAEQIATTIDSVSINCPTCGEYDIARSVLAAEQLQRLEPQERRDALDKAKRSAEPGTRPMITTYLLTYLLA